MKEKALKLGAELKTFRQRRAWSQSTLAYFLRKYGAVTVDIMTISRWECGTRQPSALNEYVVRQAMTTIEQAERRGDLKREQCRLAGAPA